MKAKMKLLMMIFMSVFIMSGCGEKQELETIPQVSLEDIINTDEEVDDEECPEGYVYDYQVSMEPIPEEIAALGGEVCGTIHAYPTEIKKGLVQQEIEEDKELQVENEICIEGVRKYLTEMYGGEYEISPITTGIWSYVCVDKKTGKEFSLYINPAYMTGREEEVVTADDYYYEENGYEYAEKLNEVIENLQWENYIQKVFLERVSLGNLKLYMAVFCNEEPDYLYEQEKILQIYEVMKEMQDREDEDMTIEIIISYFPIEYQTVIVSQYQKSVSEMMYISNRVADKLLENGELYAQFDFEGDKGVTNSLDEILDNKEQYYENEYILPYWRGLE